MKATSSLIDKSDLGDLLVALLGVNESVPPQDPAKMAYDNGFRSALAAIARSYSLNLPEIREAESRFQRTISQPTQYDGRL